MKYPLCQSGQEMTLKGCPKQHYDSKKEGSPIGCQSIKRWPMGLALGVGDAIMIGCQPRGSLG